MSNPSGTQIQNFLTLPEAQALLQEIAVPEAAMQNWLARLVLLYDIPFQNLVPDTRLLPQESLRFFYLDPGWLDAMVDGALSIGNHTSLEVMFTNVMAGVAKQASAPLLAQIRQQLQGLQPDFSGQPDPSQLLSGMMLRSQIVSDWPGLQIIPAYAVSTVSPVPLRFEKIGADLLLIIFPAVPESILIRQPAHALAFGVEDGNAQTGYNIYLRGLGGAFPSGAELGETHKVTLQASGTGLFRAGDKQVLDITTIMNALQANLQAAGALTAPAALTPGAFALQMVKTSEQVTFNPPASLNSTPQ